MIENQTFQDLKNKYGHLFSNPEIKTVSSLRIFNHAEKYSEDERNEYRNRIDENTDIIIDKISSILKEYGS